MPDKICLKNINYIVHQKPLLKNISFSLSEGEQMIITGSSGAGKSTLLEICAGLIKPHGGHVYINGRDINRISQLGLIAIRQEMGFVFQQHALICNMDAFENIALPLRYHLLLSEKDIEKRVLQLLEKFTITHLKKERPEEFSLSEAKRVAIARSIIMNPKLLFLDQPLSGLDPIAAHSILNILEDLLKQKNLTMLISSHDIQLIKQLRCKISILEQGNLIYFDDVANLSNDNKPEIISFLEGKI